MLLGGSCLSLTGLKVSTLQAKKKTGGEQLIVSSDCSTLGEPAASNRKQKIGSK